MENETRNAEVEVIAVSFASDCLSDAVTGLLQLSKIQFRACVTCKKNVAMSEYALERYPNGRKYYRRSCRKCCSAARLMRGVVARKEMEAGRQAAKDCHDPKKLRQIGRRVLWLQSCGTNIYVHDGY